MVTSLQRNLPFSYWKNDVQGLDPKLTDAGSSCEVMPCDRLLIFKMLKRWYSRENDPKGRKVYLQRFNTLVQVSRQHDARPMPFGPPVGALSMELEDILDSPKTYQNQKKGFAGQSKSGQCFGDHLLDIE